MLNFIWTREPSEAYLNPYEYDAQEQFSREALAILNEYKNQMESYNRLFSRDDTSFKKAIWMLQMDAIDSLLECHYLLSIKKHKIAGRLFRDTIEVLDIAAFFNTKTERSKKLLGTWFIDEVIPNREYRDYIKKNQGEERAKQLASFYSQLSKINHRSYRSLAYGYILGKNSTLVYDGFQKSDLLVFPGVISMYYSLLANLLKILSRELVSGGLLKSETIQVIWNECIEANPEERKFVIRESITDENN